MKKTDEFYPGRRQTRVYENINEIKYLSLDDAITLLQDKRKELTDKGWSNLDLNSGWSYDSETLEIEGTRLETDEEVKNRISLAERNKEHRRMQFERLAKEFK